MSGEIAKGAIISFDDGAAGVFVVFPCVISAKLDPQKIGRVENVCLGSVFKTTISTIMDAGEITLTMQYDPVQYLRCTAAYSVPHILKVSYPNGQIASYPVRLNSVHADLEAVDAIIHLEVGFDVNGIVSLT